MLDMGTTTLTNAQLLDASNNGRGLFRDIWTSPSGPFKGSYQVGSADCMTWLKALLEPSSPLRPASKVKNYDQFQVLLEQYERKVNELFIDRPRPDMGLQYRKVADWDPENDRVVRFPVESLNLGKLLPGVLVRQGAVEEEVWDQPAGRVKRLRVQYDGPGQPTYAGPKDAGRSTVEDPALGVVSCRRKISVTEISRRDCENESLPEIDRYLFARVKETEHQVAVFDQSELVVSHGEGLDALGPSFVSLDLMNGTWIGDAIGVAVGSRLCAVCFAD